MDPQLGKKVCYVQFPQRFDGIDRSDRYANHNTVFFDVSNGVVSYLYFSWVISLWVLNVWQFVDGTPKTTGITGIRVCTRWSEAGPTPVMHVAMGITWCKNGQFSPFFPRDTQQVSHKYHRKKNDVGHFGQRNAHRPHRFLCLASIPPNRLQIFQRLL
jgi:hypothetical protein